MNLREVKVLAVRGESYYMDGKNTIIEPVYKYGCFHEWEQFIDGDYARKNAIIELEDGSVIRCLIEDFTFIN